MIKYKKQKNKQKKKKTPKKRCKVHVKKAEQFPSVCA